MRKALLPQPRTAAGYILNKRSLLPIWGMEHDKLHVCGNKRKAEALGPEERLGQIGRVMKIGIDLQDASDAENLVCINSASHKDPSVPLAKKETGTQRWTDLWTRPDP